MTKRVPMKIYVSGPFTSSDPRKVAENIRKAKEIGIKLAKMGHDPYVPHTHIGGWETEISYWEIMRIHLTFIKDWADAVFFIAPSPGANIEKAEAEMLGIPVFTSMEQIGQKDTTFLKQVLCKQSMQQLPLLRLQSQFA